jgi:hypothetical protein
MKLSEAVAGYVGHKTKRWACAFIRKLASFDRFVAHRGR